MGKDITSHEFLEAHTIYEDIYVTGMFYSGITIYNQQIRTLNLIYFLTQDRKIKYPDDNGKSKTVIIIGGGVSGITAAIGLKKRNYDVILLEEKSLLLHLQHGCSTRIIHPHLNLWPQIDSLKKDTELPFANWYASDASEVEKQLIKEFEIVKKEPGGSITEYYSVVSSPKVNTTDKEINFKYLVETEFPGALIHELHRHYDEKKIKYEYIIIATGFGLEKYVGRQEKTKSYWRNEDLSQLRFTNQIKKFFVSGTGDGGISDICRLTLIAFDPTDWAKRFEKIKLDDTSLIDELRNIEQKHRNKTRITSYYKDFSTTFEKFKEIIKKEIDNLTRKDLITEPVLNGRKKFKDILFKNKISFINAWIIFILHELKKIEYHVGKFPDASGFYLFSEKDYDDYHIIVRHGTNNLINFKDINENFDDRNVKDKQPKPEYNNFSTKAQWNFKDWRDQGSNYNISKRYVSRKMIDFCSGFLITLNGLISNFIEAEFDSAINYRVTLHRLSYFSKEYRFQQVAGYVGTRYQSTNILKSEDIGREFPIGEGLVGIGMRTNSCFSLIPEKKEGNKFFNYKEIIARELGAEFKSFLVIPIPVPLKSKYPATLCLYMDTDEKKLVINDRFRKLIYWSMTNFIEEIDLKNVSEFDLRKNPFYKTKYIKLTNLSRIPGFESYTKELELFWNKNKLITKSNRLIDIYDK